MLNLIHLKVLNISSLPTIFKRILFLVFIIVFYSCSKNELFVNYTNPKISYQGRIDSLKAKGVNLYWPGTSIKLNFEGKSIAALIEDENGENYYNIIIDDNDPFIIRPDTTKQYHLLATGLSKGKHTIEIFRRTEWGKGKTTFYGFQLKDGAKALPKSSSKKRSIEFYGNSISAGYAIEDFSGKDSPDSTYTNNYKSYTAITSRHFNANYRCICASGTGIMVSWHPLIMPELYDRLIPSDASSKYDFSEYKPDIVVVNLFQNDSWLVNLPNNEEFKKRFGKDAPNDDYIISAYKDFVSNIRQHYPNANIICTLGCMNAVKKDSKWINYIETAVNSLNDKKIYTYFMPYIEANAHPSIEDQQIMATGLINFIETNIEW